MEASCSQRHLQAMDKINALVGIRERTCAELIERLQRSGFSAAESAQAVESAVACGLVDETRYAHVLIRSKVNAGWGKRKIVERLKRDGVPADIIASCEDCFPGRQDDLDRAVRELSKRSTSSADPYAAYMRRLVGKGYSVDLAREAVETYLANG